MRQQYSILVADSLGDEGLEILGRVGEVQVHSGLSEDQLREALPGVDALVVRSATKVTARALETADRLTVIGRAGIGIDNIDVPAATERGIVVMNTPDAGATTTAELAIALLVSLARRIPAADHALKSGRWDKKKFSGVELTGKTFGVVGLGNIGRIVADRGKGLGMTVISYDPFVPQERAPAGIRMVDLDELCAESDFVSIHVPLLDDTRHLFDAARFAKMKEGARLIHAARGGIVDEAALRDALESGRLAGAALDVFESEPLAEDHWLRSMSNVVLTPHIGASTAEASRNVARHMAEQIVTCLHRGIAINGINVPRIAPGDIVAVEPYLKLAHDLARFVVKIFPGKVQSLRLSVQGGLPSSAAAPLTMAALAGALHNAAEGAVTQVNAQRTAEQLGVRVHTETTTLKQDFLNLLRVEVVVDEVRHFATGTVLGHRHGRLIELDDYLIDAIPEPPLMVTRHHDVPGVLGQIGTLMGSLGVNIDRMQLGDPPGDGAPALGIWNLEQPLDDAVRAQIAALPCVEQVFVVD